MFVTDKIIEFAKSEPDRIALVYGDQTYTYAEFADKIIAVSNALGRLKVKREAHIISVAMPSLEYVALCYGIQLYGAVHIPVEKNLGPDRICEIVKQVDADLVIGPTAMEIPYMYLAWDDFFTPDDYVKGAYMEYAVQQFPEDECVEILFTTGSTGASKAVMHSRTTIWNYVTMVAKSCGYDDTTIFLLGTPLNHAGGTRRLQTVFSQGGTMVIVDGLTNLKMVFDTIDRWKVNSTYLPPSWIHMILRFASPQLAGLKDQLKMIYTGSAPYPETDQLKMCELLPNTRLISSLGSSEAGSICQYVYSENGVRPHCVGKPLENVQVKFKGPDNLVCVKSPSLMLGYYKSEELMKTCIDEEGFFVTSDSGYFDEDGYVCFGGRADDVINVGGFKIAPLELESVVLEWAEISECICIAVPDKLTGSALKLLYVSDGEIDLVGLKSFIADRLENYKVPQKYERVDHIEKTANGKVNRKVYRNL